MDITIITKAENNAFNYIFVSFINEIVILLIFSQFVFAALIIFIKKGFYCAFQTKVPSTDNDKNNTIFIV